jgi:hypothetical protein
VRVAHKTLIGVAVLGIVVMLGGSAVATAGAAFCLSNDYIGGPDLATGQTIVRDLSPVDVPKAVSIDIAEQRAVAFNTGAPGGDGPVLGAKLALVKTATDGERPMFVVAQAGPDGPVSMPGGLSVTIPCRVMFEDPATGDVLFGYANMQPAGPQATIGPL